jgi:hypothetical protein
VGWAQRANPIAQAARARSPRLGELVDQQRLRELAGGLADEAELQRVLSATDPSLRDEVERAIRPWCRFVSVEAHG